MILSVEFDPALPSPYKALVLTGESGAELGRWSGESPHSDWCQFLAFSEDWSAEEKQAVTLADTVFDFIWNVPGWRMGLGPDGRSAVVPEDSRNFLAYAKDRLIRGWASAEDLGFHPKPSVRIWNQHLHGDSNTRIALDEGLSAAGVRKILEQDPPEVIRQDLRYQTGLRAFWLTQHTIKGEDDRSFPFLILLMPHKVTNASYRKAAARIARETQEKGDHRRNFGIASEYLDMPLALKFSHRKGYPCWEMDAEGNAMPYDGRFADIVPHDPKTAGVEDQEAAPCR